MTNRPVDQLTYVVRYRTAIIGRVNAFPILTAKAICDYDPGGPHVFDSGLYKEMANQRSTGDTHVAKFNQNSNWDWLMIRPRSQFIDMSLV